MADELQGIFTGYARVLVQGDLAFVQHVVERGPAASRVEFRRRTEQVLATDDAHVLAILKVLVVDTWRGREGLEYFLQ